MNDVLAAFRDGPAARHVESIQQIKQLADMQAAASADTIVSEMLMATFKAGYEAGRADLMVELRNKDVTK